VILATSCGICSRAANQRGATLMVVFVAIVMIGLAAGVTGATWKTVVQKSKEEELLFRGDQYRRAIESYTGTGPPGAAAFYPARLEDLIRDPRSPATVRHIRRLYRDPVTGGEWVLIKDQLGRIKGVRSASELEPFRKDNFPEGYERLRGAESYSAWEFVVEPGSTGQPAPEQP
jgi:type II secretory pathway pseudopilin PulG